jgi:hypothetical protein
MSTVTDTRSDLEDFHRWLGEKLKKGLTKFNVAQSVEEYRLYCEARDHFREELRPILERRARGEDHSIPWDKEAFLAELDRRLAEKDVSRHEQNPG